MNQIKFNYSYGGEFTYTDSTPFSGYFNINELGEAYSGRYFNENSHILLTPESVYSADYYRSSNFRDRYVYDTLELPNKLESILIQPSELVNYASINSKIKLLHENLIYLHSKMFMGATNSPTDDNYYVLCNQLGTNTLEWAETPAAFGVLSAISDNTEGYNLKNYTEFDKIKKFVIIPTKTESYSIFGISDTYLIGLTAENVNGILQNTKITYYNNVIDNNSGEECIHLEDIIYNGKYIYVTDSQINGGGQIFKYDINAYYTNDSIFAGNIFLIETIGGSGDSANHFKFNGCTTLGKKDNEILVYDEGNNAIKVFDLNFVWKTTFKINNSYYKILDIKYRKLNNNLYFLYKNTNTESYGLIEYDSNYTQTGDYPFSDVLSDYETGFNSFEFSQQDSNVFYISTSKTIYKKFFSKLKNQAFSEFNIDKFYPVGSFIWNFTTTNWENLDKLWNGVKSKFNIKDIIVIPENENNTTENIDNVFSLAEFETTISNLSGSCIYKFKETTDYTSVLRNINLKYYNFNKISLDKNEYNQAFVLNKEFYKLFSNIIQFKNSLKGRFYFEYGQNDELLLRDIYYFTDDEINSLNIDLEYNCYINDNELVQPNVINRMLKKIYEFQQSSISLTNVKVKNLKKENNKLLPIGYEDTKLIE